MIVCFNSILPLLTVNEKEDTMSKPYVRLDKNDAAVLLVDHQAGLLSLVRDIDPDRFKNNVLALADLAKYFNLPTILTTSFETGPNGPLVPELKEIFRTDQCLGQRRIPGCRESNRQKATDYCGCRDRGVCCISSLVGP